MNIGPRFTHNIDHHIRDVFVYPRWRFLRNMKQWVYFKMLHLAACYYFTSACQTGFTEVATIRSVIMFLQKNDENKQTLTWHLYNVCPVTSLYWFYVKVLNSAACLSVGLLLNEADREKDGRIVCSWFLSLEIAK